MTLHFGIHFDGPVYAPKEQARQGDYFAGPFKLLQFIENQLGISPNPDNTDYLRIELYRQSLQWYLEKSSQPPFYAASFETDRFAVATALLQWRDQLLLSGWNFEVLDNMPERLHCIAAVEVAFLKKMNSPELIGQTAGFSDRFQRVLQWLENHQLPIDQVRFYAPEGLHPNYIRRWIRILRQQGISLHFEEPTCAAAADTRLGRFQRTLLHQPSKAISTPDPEDHSLLVLKVRRDSDAAVYVSQWIRENAGFRPLMLIPEMNLSMEMAVAMEGLPSMGILSSSLARPSLQALKLAPAFLWEPVDVYKLMEFVTLSVKPLDEGLSLEIARVLAEKPGLFSDQWFAAVFGYLERAEVPEEAREQYEFWFDRRRYRADGTAPKRDAIQIYDYLAIWARQFYEKNNRKNPSLLVLAGQAGNIRDLLETLPEQRLSFLELERIVRTVYDPSPALLAPAETDGLPYIHQGGALITAPESLLWWNFVYHAQTAPPDPWSETEIHWLEQQKVLWDNAQHWSTVQQWMQQKPILSTQRQLVLVAPDQVAGQEIPPALLLGDLSACFQQDTSFIYHLDDPNERARLKNVWNTSDPSILKPRLIGRHQPHIRIPRPEMVLQTEYDTPTNLENLFYYPHRWFFRQKLRMYPGGILKIVVDNTLYGNLAHRFFELLLQEDLTALNRNKVQQWVDEKAENLLEKEGATLLLYGREPERNAFLNRVKNAAWSLIDLLRSNQWEVAHTEWAMEGAFCGIPIKGKADLILQRGDEWAIVDLKWAGANRRKELIRNEEDLQLALYASLLQNGRPWPYTAYFIIEEGKMIARNRKAFKDALLAGAEDIDHNLVYDRMYQKMENTLLWRQEQLQQGIIEVRSARTAAELEMLYEGLMLDFLEMKNEDARWDDYRTLLEFMV
jgi:ATP-dependent helicase/nuclease subunit B